MGKIVKAVLSVGAIVAGVVTANPALIAAGLSIGSSVLRPKPPRNSPANFDRLRANIDPLTPRKTVVGITALATDIRDEEFTDSQTYFHRFIVCASHKVQSIDEIWFDDKRVWTSAGGVEGEAVGYLTVATRTEGSAANAINISTRMGSTRRYTGLAYVHLRYKLTGNSKKAESPYAQSITTRITIRGKAAFLPDPRDPAQDMEDQSTWTWDADACRNPALALLFYLLGWRINGELAVGKGIPPDRIDLDSFITAANLCDEPVDKVGGGTEPRYRCDGAWSEADDPTTVIDMLKATMNADLDDVGGKLRLTVFHNDLATPVVDFNDNDIIDGFTWQPQQPLDATFNVVRGLYTDASDASLYQQADYPEQREDSPDGIDRLDTFNLPMVQSAGQAQRLAALRLARQQYGGVFEAEFQATAWKVSKNSVVRLSFSQTGFTTKFFRVAEMTVQQDGVVPLVLREEDPAIYGDPPITGPISPIFSTPYDPALNPLVQAINLNEQTLIAISAQVGISITATATAITVSAHDREYRDRLVAIAGVVITTDAAGSALVPDTTYYLYYDDGDRDGLNGEDPLEWKATTDFIAAQNSAANPLRHFAGIITTDVIGGTGTVGSGVGGVDSIGAPGPVGPAGLNSAPVLIYQRSASAPAAPSADATYTFATGGLTGLNNGWTATIPAANGQPLWVRQASASSTSATDIIPAAEWSTAQQLAADGTVGGNSAVVYIYQRAASAPASPPSNTLTYTFATGVLSGTINNGWSATIPAANGQPLWVRTAVAFGPGATDTIATGEWSSSVQLVEDGAPGLNTATVSIYKRAATAPTDTPSTGATYTFATGALTGTLNGWTTAIPAANGQPLWARQAVASSTTATDTIASGEWSAVTQPVVDGAPGANAATVFLYRRSATTPAVPSVTSTYTFATGVLTGQNNSWTQAIPAGTDPLYVITAAAVGTGTTDTILTGEWSSPVILAQDGVAGLNTARVLIYRRAATTPTLPSATTTFTFATGGLAGLNNGWTTTIPTADGNPLWVSAATASNTTATDTIAAGEWVTPTVLAEDGAPGSSGAVITLYRRAAETPVPAKPTSTSMVYTFATGVVTNTDFWSQTPPAANGAPLWVTQLAVSGTGATVTVSGASFSTPVIVARDGVSATTGQLTNPAHTVATAADGTGYSLVDAGGNFEVYFGGANVRLTSTFSIVGGTDGGANWTKTQNGLTLTISELSGVYTLAGAAWTSDEETFTLRAVYQTVTLEQTYTISKSKAGADGSPAKVIRLTQTREKITVNSAGAFSPATQDTVFTVERQGTSTAVVWTLFNQSGGSVSSALLTGTGDSRTLSTANFETARGSTNGVRVVATITDGVTISDTTDLIRVQDGIDSNQVRISTNFETFPFIAHTGQPVTQTASLNANLTAISGTVTWRLKAEGSETLITPTSSWATVSGNNLTITQAQFAQFLIDYPGTTMRVVATLGGFSDERVLTRVADATTNPAGGSFIRTRNGDVSFGGWVGAATSTTVPAGTTRPGARSLQLATNSRERPPIARVIRPGDSFRLRYTIRTIGSGTACGNIFFALYNDAGTPLTTSTSFANLPIHAPNVLDWTYVDQVITYTGTTEIINWCPGVDSINATIGNVLFDNLDMDFAPVNPVAAGNANRVPFSRMEGGQGWLTSFANIPITTATRPVTTAGRTLIRTDGAPTTSGQQLFVSQSSARRFSVVAGERLSVSVGAEVQALTGAAPGLWQIYLEYLDSAGSVFTSQEIGSGTGAVLATNRQAAFLTVPTNAVQAQMVMRTDAGGAGTLYSAIEGPMVTSAAVGQTVHPPFTPGPNSDDGADVTATAQRSIEPQFPVIEIKQGEAGHTGNRTVTHAAKRGTSTITGGTWSLPVVNLGAGSATINSSTGTVTLSGIVQSGAYAVRYTHTDGIATDQAVNVTYVPTPTGGVNSAKTARATSSAGTANNNLWQDILILTMNDCPAGRVSFGAFGLRALSVLDPVTGTGTADFEARLTLDGVALNTVPSQNVVTGGVMSFTDFQGLFEGTFAVTSGSRTFRIQMRRTSGTGTILTTTTVLEPTIIAT